MNSPIIETKDLSLTRSGREILADVSLAVGPGEWVSIIGPNGAGKTTLLKCLIGLETRYSGSIIVSGRRRETMSYRQMAKLAAYVPQGLALTVPHTVSEFLAISRYAHLGRLGRLEEIDRCAIDRAFSQTSTAPLADRKVTTLSGGEKQKVMIASALVQEPKVLLLDEPTTYLDPKHQSDINRTLFGLKSNERIAVLAVTHDLNVGLNFADRIIALKEGRIIFSGLPKEVDKSLLEALYDKEFIIMPHPRTGLPLMVPD